MSVRFNALADRLTRAANLPSWDFYTFGIFVQLVASTGAETAIVALEDAGGPPGDYHVLKTAADGVTLHFQVAVLGVPVLDLNAGALTVGSWYFVAVVRDDPNATLYIIPVDGSAGSSDTGTDSTSITFASMTICGSQFGEPGNYRLAGGRIWSQPLTFAELVREARSWHPVRFADLLYHLRFLNAGEKLVDFSGNGWDLSAPGAGPWETEENPPITWRAAVSPLSFRPLPSVSLTGAVAGSTHSVLVGVSGLVQAQNPLLDGDALNASTWIIQNLDTGAFLTPCVVRRTDTLTFEVQTLEAFESSLVAYRISTTTLLDAVGLPLIAPTQADFLGALAAAEATPQARLVGRNAAARDLTNVQVPGSIYQGGTLQISGGDYANVSGPALLEKLIMRRLLARPGDYYHLPNYGVGLREKEPVPIPDLAKMKARIEQQVLLEPEVRSVRAVLTVDSDGLVIVQVHTTQRDGSVLELPAVRQGGVVL